MSSVELKRLPVKGVRVIGPKEIMSGRRFAPPTLLWATGIALLGEYIHEIGG